MTLTVDPRDFRVPEGTRVDLAKIFLHESKDTQRKRFMKRIDDPDKNWKL